MRVTIEHRQKTTGLGSAQSQFVRCMVLFSEEEKAIIGVRGLKDHVVVLDPPSPPPTHREYMTAGILRSVLTTRRNHWPRTSPILDFSWWKARGLWWIPFVRVADRLGHRLPYGPIDGHPVHSPEAACVDPVNAFGPFTVYAPDPAYSDLVVEQIRERLTILKHTIFGSAEIRPKETYEL